MNKLNNEFDQLQDVINDCQTDITKDEFNKRVKLLNDVNLSHIIESTDETDLAGELACSGGSCEISSL